MARGERWRITDHCTAEAECRIGSGNEVEKSTWSSYRIIPQSDLGGWIFNWILNVLGLTDCSYGIVGMENWHRTLSKSYTVLGIPISSRMMHKVSWFSLAEYVKIERLIRNLFYYWWNRRRVSRTGLVIDRVYGFEFNWLILRTPPQMHINSTHCCDCRRRIRSTSYDVLFKY